MKNIIIGIVPTINLFKNENPYDDKYTFTNNYSSKIIKAGATPIGILLNNGSLDKNSLEICDAFLLPGGNRMYSIHFEIIEYAIKNKKPILGICLGMQAMACYSRLKEYAEKRNIKPTPNNLVLLRKELQKENIFMLEPLKSNNIHGEKIMNNEIEITTKTLKESKHNISIIHNTKLYDILKKDDISVTSLHSYRIYESGKDFIISATASDGTIEAIESKDNSHWMIGLQYHPEIEDDNNIWNEFIKETIKNKEAK